MAEFELHFRTYAGAEAEPVTKLRWRRASCRPGFGSDYSYTGLAYGPNWEGPLALSGADTIVKRGA